MNGPQNILLVLDDTPEVLNEAIRIARQHQAKLTGLFVMDATWNGYVAHDWLSGSGSRADFLDYIKDEEEKSARVALQMFETATQEMKDAEFILAAGNVVEQVTAHIQKGFDLVIMGKPMRRGLEIMRDGVAEVCHKATCKVLLVSDQKA